MTVTKKNQIPALVLDICEGIHSQYGPGLMKEVYEDVLCYELAKRSIAFVRQYPIDLIHDGVLMNVSLKADMVVEDTILIEIRSAARLDEVDARLITTYVRLSGLSRGLLINFNEAVLKNGIREVVNEFEE